MFLARCSCCFLFYFGESQVSISVSVFCFFFVSLCLISFSGVSILCAISSFPSLCFYFVFLPLFLVSSSAPHPLCHLCLSSSVFLLGITPSSSSPAFLLCFLGISMSQVPGFQVFSLFSMFLMGFWLAFPSLGFCYGFQFIPSFITLCFVQPPKQRTNFQFKPPFCLQLDPLSLSSTHGLLANLVSDFALCYVQMFNKNMYRSFITTKSL